jgi:hypothetical protein
MCDGVSGAECDEAADKVRDGVCDRVLEAVRD